MFSDLFRYRKKFDTSVSHTNCEHDIIKYKWKFSDGYEEDVDEPVYYRFFSQTGKYSVHCTFITDCIHPQTVIIGMNFEVKWYDMLIFL